MRPQAAPGAAFRCAARRWSAPPPSRNSRLILGLVAGGGLFVAVAAALIAIPRFAASAQQAREREGAEMLREAHTVQSNYAAEHHAYARTLEELRSAGWEPRDSTRYYDRVEIASAELSYLCMHALPKPGAKVRLVRIRTLGEVDYGVRCGEFDPSRNLTSEATEVLLQVHSAVRAWRYAYKRFPATDEELAEAYPAANTDPDFTVGLTRGRNGGFCVHVAPRSMRPSPVISSMDGTGHIYPRDGCTGNFVE
jgi:hypothetical protein